jgi:DNA polymerase-3 subunit gamma/tau
MRDALSLLDQAIAYGGGNVGEAVVRQMIGAVDSEFVVSLIEAVAAGDANQLFAEARAIAERNLSFDAALQDLAVMLHDIALLQVVPDAVAADLPARDRLVAVATRMDPESVQLDYQIAVQGREDLAIAPDHFAGFSMTLLRMLAFAPATASGAAREASPREPAVPARSGVSSAPPAKKSPISAARPDNAAKPPMMSEANLDDWPRWVGECKLSGMAHQLAYNAELKAYRRTPAGIEIELALGEANRHLADRGYQDKLSEALSSALAAPVRLSGEIGGVGETSMAAQDRRARQALQEQATATFTEDPFVKDAVRLFDARIRPQSIQPIPSQQGTKS